jgi:flagellar biosynthesis/type III secretory pathway chaperone
LIKDSAALENASLMIWKASDMEDKELTAILKEIGESMRRAQALNLANSYLLAEIVRQLADAATNRHDYLVGMFERIDSTG